MPDGGWIDSAAIILPTGTVFMRREYCQAVIDGDGQVKQIDVECDDPDVASVGIGDVEGAFLAHRWVSDWERNG